MNSEKIALKEGSFRWKQRKPIRAAGARQSGFYPGRDHERCRNQRFNGFSLTGFDGTDRDGLADFGF